MTDRPTKQQLSEPRRRLVEKLQEINFGRIEGLVIHDREPVLDPMPRIVREIKFRADNGHRPEAAKGDFLLKDQVLELFAHITALGDGVIQVLEVQHGLPFRMSIEEVMA